jgi:hypothetical protein
MKSIPVRGVVAVVALALAPLANAGRSCEQRPPTALAVTRAMQLAEHTAARLAQSGADVVVIARAGQNLSEYGIRYSHLGFAYRDGASTGAPWRVVHKLNQCGSARASLYRQGLGEFFLDDLWQYEAAIVVLAPAVQEHLRPVLASNESVAASTRPRTAWSPTRGPSATSSRINGRSRPSPWPRNGTRRHASAPKRGCGCTATNRRRCTCRRSSASVRASPAPTSPSTDHPDEKRFSDRIETVTVDSVFRWLERDGRGGPPQVVR